MTLSLRTEIRQSWVRLAPSLRELVALFEPDAPTRLRDVIARLRTVETVHVGSDVTTAEGVPLGGRIDLVLRSDGTYEFSGHMRATGFLSYHYAVQAWVSTDGVAVVAAQKVGHVYGADTPGDCQQDWSETGTHPGIVLYWPNLRRQASAGYRLDAEMGGVLGAIDDVLCFALKGLALGAVLGPAGWLVLIGNEFTDLDTRLASQDTLAGLVVGAGTFYLLGPFGLLPAVVAGAATVALADVRHRPMEEFERDFARRVFGNHINYDKVLLTNLTHNGGLKFTIPSVNGTILINLGDGYDAPVRAADKNNYVEPGSAFIHELTHAWQITNRSFLGVICGMSSDYSYFDAGKGRFGDDVWKQRSFDFFNNEQQAHIVDDWYRACLKTTTDANGNVVGYAMDTQGSPVTDLDGIDALNDPAYRFIRDNIRTGQP